MNERIRELANKALKHPDTDNDGLTVFDNDELKKFAELIVKECMIICEDVAERNDPAIACYYEIKRTFRS
jgi:hypothetical protein